MLRRSFSTLKTAAESLAASQVKANKFIASNVEPIITRQIERGADFAHLTTRYHPQLWDDYLVESVAHVLREKGYNVTHEFYQYKPMEHIIRDNETIRDKGNAEVVMYVDWHIGE